MDVSDILKSIFQIFKYRIHRKKNFGLDSIAYRASQLWKTNPEEIRISTSLPMFKKKIKKIPLISGSCNYCRKYIHHVGFIYLFYIFNWINLSASCSPVFRMNLALVVYVQLSNSDNYSDKSCLHFWSVWGVSQFF